MRTWPDFIFGAIIGAAAAALGGCASGPTAAQERLSAGARRELACTPLVLVINGGDGAGGGDGPKWLGCGSGVMVHPRILLTANHVVPPDPRYVTVFDGDGPDARGEAVRIDRVVRGSGSLKKNRSGPDERWGDDWALIVLEQPFQKMEAVVAAHMPDVLAQAPAPGRVLVIAGFPFTDQGRDHVDPLARTGILIRTSVVPPPRGVPEDDSLFYAASGAGNPEREGSSGGPVLALSGDGPPTLVGVYLGRADSRFIGIAVGHALIVQRLPVAAIRGAIRDLAGSE